MRSAHRDKPQSVTLIIIGFFFPSSSSLMSSCWLLVVCHHYSIPSNQRVSLYQLYLFILAPHKTRIDRGSNDWLIFLLFSTFLGTFSLSLSRSLIRLRDYFLFSLMAVGGAVVVEQIVYMYSIHIYNCCTVDEAQRELTSRGNRGPREGDPICPSSLCLPSS